MGFETVLKFSLIPTVLLLLLSLVSIVLTSHYWVLGDWIMGRWVPVPSQFKEKDRFPIDDVIVDWSGPSTDATIVSGCLNLFTAVITIVAWKKLRNRDLDSDFHQPLRRFYVGSVFVTGAGGISAAVASIILHYTDRGNDEYSCTPSVGKTTGGVPFTNLFCTREMGACNFAKPKLEGTGKYWAASLACNETVVVKWLQVVLIVNVFVVMAMFAWQARQRRTTRWSQIDKQG